MLSADLLLKICFLLYHALTGGMGSLFLLFALCIQFVTSVLVLSCLVCYSCPIIATYIAYDHIGRRDACVFGRKFLYFNRIGSAKEKNWNFIQLNWTLQHLN